MFRAVRFIPERNRAIWTTPCKLEAATGAIAAAVAAAGPRQPGPRARRGRLSPERAPRWPPGAVVNDRTEAAGAGGGVRGFINLLKQQAERL